MTFFPQIFALIYQILSRQTFTHFLKFMLKNPQHDRVKRGGGEGSRAVYTMCKKTSDLVEDGFPYIAIYWWMFHHKSYIGIYLPEHWVSAPTQDNLITREGKWMQSRIEIQALSCSIHILSSEELSQNYLRISIL